MGLLPIQQAKDFNSWVLRLQQKANRAQHRYLVALSGTETWSSELLVSLADLFNDSRTLYVSEDTPPDSFPSIHLKGTKVKQTLGQDVDHVIWNGFHGLSPDGIGAATGLIKGGGLFFLQLPELETLVSKPDPDYARMCGSEEEMENCSTLFLQRFANNLKHHSGIYLFEESNYHYPELELIQEPTPPSINTGDQQIAVEQILKTAHGRARRPLVMTADRGRGKSAALGIAAASLNKNKISHVAITGPSQVACEISLDHYTRNKQEESAELSFYAPDELLQNNVKADLVFVDEAATIPADLLSKILSRYPRIVFASTVHGYEGTGRGFAIRFKKILDSQTPQWGRVELRNPIRWAVNDPLEDWIFKVLCLNAEYRDADEDSSKEDTSNVSITWLNRQVLAENEKTLATLFGLLVNAHYQTSPNDLRMLLDHPRVTVGVLECDSTNHIIGTVVLIDEGGISDKALGEAIIHGTRKPKSHLLPQVLTYDSSEAKLLGLRTYRIMRIAIDPNQQRKGLGSKLLEATIRLAETENMDYVSTSFGLTLDLLHFWQRNHFQLARIGRHRDAASGLESAAMIFPISSDFSSMVGNLSRHFLKRFQSGLQTHFQSMDPALVWDVLKHLSPYKLEQGEADNDLIVQGVVYHHRSIEDSIIELQAFIQDRFHILQTSRNNGNSSISAQERASIIMAVWQGVSWQTIVERLDLSGKKEAQLVTRAGLRKLYELT